MGLWDDLEDLLFPLFSGLDGLFGGGDTLTVPPERAGEVFPPGLLARIPPSAAAPSGPGALQRGAEAAAGAYVQGSAAVALTDDKLAELLKKVIASNDATRAKIAAIVGNIGSAHRALMSDPALAQDPHAQALFNQMLDQQLAEIQRLLQAAKVDSAKQAELLAALGKEYHDTSGAHRNDAGEGGGAGGGADAGGGGGAGGAGAAFDPGAAAGGGVNDPLAGMAGLPAGLMGDPMSMLGPALSSLGALPAAFGGAGTSLPMDALGALGALAGRGAGDGFGDEESRERARPADFVDDSHRKPEGPDDGAGKDKDDGEQHKPAVTAVAATPPQAAPAAAPTAGDPGLVVRMPDGTPVTATSPQHAAAVHAVLNGASVTDAWRPYVQLPPPGTPVTTPADPSHLVPGQVAQCKSREPVMYMGNGKIWLDGQLQPQSALPAGEFLGWEDPTQRAGGLPAPAPASVPATVAPAGI